MIKILNEKEQKCNIDEQQGISQNENNEKANNQILEKSKLRHVTLKKSMEKNSNKDISKSKIDMKDNETDNSNKCKSYEDISQLHPLLSDFAQITNNKKSIYPYKWIVYNGNYWDTIAKVLKPRGYNLISSKDDDRLDNINFIWRPTQFSYHVKILIKVVLFKNR